MKYYRRFGEHFEPKRGEIYKNCLFIQYIFPVLITGYGDKLK